MFVFALTYNAALVDGVWLLPCAVKPPDRLVAYDDDPACVVVLLGKLV